MKLKLLNDWVLLYKCTKDHIRNEDGGILIELTDKTLDNTNYLEIISVGPKCREVSKDCIGRIVRTSNWSHDLMNLKRALGDGYWIIREKALLKQSPILVETEA